MPFTSSPREVSTPIPGPHPPVVRAPVVASGVRPCAATCVATALSPCEHGCCSTGHAHALTHAFLLRQVNRVQVLGGSQAHSSCRASRGLRRATCCSDGVLRVPLRPVRVSAR
jgi:hypothetical protein